MIKLYHGDCLEEMKKIAEIIDLVITRRDDAQAQEQAKAMVKELTGRFPIFAEEWKVS